MSFIEKDVPVKYTAFINLFILAIFIPFLLYAVYQSVILFSRASGKPANIIVEANNPVPPTNNRLQPREKSKTGTPPKTSIFTLINGLSGTRLNVSGEGTWVNAIASKDGSKYSILIFNLDDIGKHTESVPVTVNGLLSGTYNSRLTYLMQTGCALNDPPSDKPPREKILTGQTISTVICITPQNAALWELDKLK
jgi:hypothetical protein